MAKKQFKAESKRLLDLMIHSIYTHREIFLRELISNASDAMDKLYFRSLTDPDLSLSREDLTIRIVPDQQARTLTIVDSGCGMTKEELENNLGTIAHSGSLAFKEDQAVKDQQDVEIIGQFGVGFYSAFMVSDQVTVKTKAYGSDEAWCWQSSGTDGYTITPCEKDTWGTEITLKIKADTDEESYQEFLDPYRIQDLVKRYSDYIRYPIQMEMTHEHLKEGTKDEYESHTQLETLNSMVPIWRKSKDEVTEEEYNNFYKEKFFDFEDPLCRIHSKTEGVVSYNALLYIPAKAPYNYYSKDFEKGLQLYSNGVLIMDRCPDLLPDCFSFVKGLVDSEDFSLNISREMLQHDRQLKLVARNLEKKIHSELLSMLKNDREKYEKFFQSFGLQLKYSLYSNFGEKRELLQDLVMFPSSKEEKLVTLQEYVSRMPQEQKYIYYACGETVAQAAHLPQAERVQEKGYELLYLTQDVDEFALRVLGQYGDKAFKSVSDGDLGLESEEEKQELKDKIQANQSLLDAMQQALGDKVTSVTLSQRLKTLPVCISTQGGLTLEMEKVLNAMPNDHKLKAQRVLEINGDHPVFQTLQTLQEKDPQKVAQYAQLLYTQALLLEGLPVENPADFANAVCSLMVQSVPQEEAKD